MTHSKAVDDLTDEDIVEMVKVMRLLSTDNPDANAIIDQLFPDSEDAVTQDLHGMLTLHETRQKFIAAAQNVLRRSKTAYLSISLVEFTSWLEALKTNPDTPIPEFHT